mgnify:CR=1 FL=1
MRPHSRKGERTPPGTNAPRSGGPRRGTLPSPESDNLTRAIVGVSVALALLSVGGVFIFGSLLGPRQTEPLVELPWVQPTAQAFIMLSALAIASLCLGRYRALGGAWAYWTGALFLANATLGLFYLLSWPGLVGEGGVIARLPNTASWLFLMTFLCIALLLLAINARQPERFRRSHVFAGYGIVGAAAALVGLLSVLFESALPTMIVGFSFTPFTLLSDGFLILLMALGAVWALRRYRSEQNAVLGYLALFLVVMAFGLLDTIMGGKRYDFWWYTGRLLFVASYVVLLFGFLQEGYQLFGRERERVEERERLLAALQAANERLMAASQQNEDRRREAQRRAAELQAVLDNMVDAVFVTSPDGRITLYNAAAIQLLGFTRFGEVKNLTAEFPRLFQLRYPDGRPIESQEMATARALRGETVVEMSQVLHNPALGEERYVRVSAAPIRDSDGQVVSAVAVVRDVTAQAEFERTKDQFIAVAAHELKTPVTIMKGSAQILLRQSEGLEAPQRKLLASMNRGADRIDRVVRDLLDISRLHAGAFPLEREKISLSELTEEVADRLTLTTGRAIRITDLEPASVLGDQARLEQVLTNLLDNAVTYSPQGSEIEVSVTKEDGQAVVSVQDRGVGIPKEKQKHMFERFYRAHTGTPYDYGGMGVGLYISQQIVQRHGGRIWFESEEGQGSTFSFSIPLAV